METAVCLLERRNNDLLTWIEDTLLKRLICLDKNSIFSADIPTDIGKQRNTLPKDTVWKNVEKSRILARLNGKLNSYYADDDDENLAMSGCLSFIPWIGISALEQSHVSGKGNTS